MSASSSLKGRRGTLSSVSTSNSSCEIDLDSVDSRMKYSTCAVARSTVFSEGFAFIPAGPGMEHGGADLVA